MTITWPRRRRGCTAPPQSRRESPTALDWRGRSAPNAASRSHRVIRPGCESVQCGGWSGASTTGGQVPSSWPEVYSVVEAVETERLVAASRLTHRYIRRVKSGERLPHRRNWPALYQAAAASALVAEPASSEPPDTTDEVPPPPAVREAALSEDSIRKISRSEFVPYRRYWTIFPQILLLGDRRAAFHPNSWLPVRKIPAQRKGNER